MMTPSPFQDQSIVEISGSVVSGVTCVELLSKLVRFNKRPVY